MNLSNASKAAKACILKQKFCLGHMIIISFPFLHASKQFDGFSNNFWHFQSLTLPIQHGRVQKGPLPPATFTNVIISPQNFLIFSFISFDRLV